MFVVSDKFVDTQLFAIVEFFIMNSCTSVAEFISLLFVGRENSWGDELVQ